MNFFIVAFNLSIVLLTVTPEDKRCGNASTVNDTYAFKYAVETSDVVTQHWEERRGDTVHGSYSFLQPNGKVRVVTYQVNGKQGFRATVTFRKPPGNVIGHLKYPKHFRRPVIFAQPVGIISSDLLKAKRTYPNLPM